MASSNKMSKLLDKIERRLGTKPLNLPEEIGKNAWANDITSIFLNQIFIDFEPPNKIRLTSVYDTDVSKGLKSYPIDLFIKHSPNLMTIPPTMMETFESLAQADVAKFLYENLKYYEIETIYANLDLKISDLESEAGKRDEIVEKLDEAHVTSANKNQPLILCV